MSYVWVQNHYTIIPSPVASIPLVRKQGSCTALPSLVHFLLYMQGQLHICNYPLLACRN